MGLEFANLPLVDASVRLYFDKDLPLTLQRGVDAWGRLEDRFPLFLDLEQMEPGLGGRSPTTFAVVPGSPEFSHFGFRFAGGNTGLDLCLQQNLLVLKWNRRFDATALPYPRFKAIEENLWWAVKVLREALPLPEISALNMRYANFIPTVEGSAGMVLTDYFSEAIAVQLLDKATMLHSIDLSWRENDQIDRRFSLSRGNSNDGTLQGFLLATVAGAQVNNGVSAEARLVELHDFLQTFFSGLISSRAKKEWGFVE